MKKWFLLGLITILMPFTTLSSFANQTTSSAPNIPTVTVLIAGDSISAGYGLNHEAGWVSLLQQQLNQQQQPIRLVNASLSGETSGGLQDRLPNLLQRHQPDYVLIEIGGNDGLRGYPLKRLKSNLQHIIEQTEQGGAKPVLLGMQIPPNFGRRYSRGFQQTFQQVAEQEQVPILKDMMEVIAQTPGWMQADGIHPSAIAQPFMADKIATFLLPLIFSGPTSAAVSTAP